MNPLLIVLGFFGLYFYHLIQSLVLCFVPSRFRRRKDINGQIVLITGAGSGIGRELAIQFSKHFTCLVLLDIDKTSLLETEKLLDRRSTVFVYECDVSKPGTVYEVAARVRDEAGDVDILVNNAGIVSGKRLLDIPDEKIVKTMEVNALAHFWMCKAFLPAMMDKNRGHIVSVASIAGKAAAPLMTDYCASKFAAVGFAEALEVELREQKMDGIKVTVVCPSHIDTGLFQGFKSTIAPTMTPQYVAEEVLKGILEEQENIYIPNSLRYLTKLKEVYPRWLWTWAFERTGDINCMKDFTGRTVNSDARSTDAKKAK